jgi:hypothetical protein
MTGQIAADEMEVNIKTVYDYYGFCGEVYYVIVTKNKNIIGEGKIVQIDEFHIYLLTVLTERLKLVMNK